MTDLLTKNERETVDAVPVLVNFGGDRIAIFTGEECAQIAEAYAKACQKEKTATWQSEKRHKKAAAELKEWRAKFKEWSNLH